MYVQSFVPKPSYILNRLCCNCYGSSEFLSLVFPVPLRYSWIIILHALPLAEQIKKMKPCVTFLSLYSCLSYTEMKSGECQTETGGKGKAEGIKCPCLSSSQCECQTKLPLFGSRWKKIKSSFVAQIALVSSCS